MIIGLLFESRLEEPFADGGRSEEGRPWKLWDLLFVYDDCELWNRVEAACKSSCVLPRWVSGAGGWE
jgi:hypothetical protein